MAANGTGRFAVGVIATRLTAIFRRAFFRPQSLGRAKRHGWRTMETREFG
jgi:hypothetical protein